MALNIEQVKDAAASAFSAVFKGSTNIVGTVVPELLTKLDDQNEHDQALEGLRVILGIRPQSLTMVMPKLIKKPVNVLKTRAIGVLSNVTNVNLLAHVPTVIPHLLLIQHNNSEDIALAASESLNMVNIFKIKLLMLILFIDS